MKYKYFAIADTHFYHAKLASLRNFTNTEEMNKFIIHQWNESVGIKDTVFIVGDFALGTAINEKRLIKKLSGKKILILGNHDKRSLSFYEENFYFVATRIDWKNYIFTHEPLSFAYIPKDKINVHGHIHDNMHPELSGLLCNRNLNVSVEVINYIPYFLKERRK